MKIYVNALIFILSIYECNAQAVVRIDFNKYTSGDFDLMIKDIMIKHGCKPYINYGSDTSRYFDYRIEYETKSRREYDELHKYQFVLYDKDNKLLNEISSSIPYLNLGVNEGKVFCDGLGLLFKRKFNCEKYFFRKEVNHFNIKFSVHKIDSSTYSFVAKGAAINSLKRVERAFLEKAKQYLDYFDYYFENSEYKYTAHGGGFGSTSHTGSTVFGIIKTNAVPGVSTKLSTKPIEFIQEFEE